MRSRTMNLTEGSPMRLLLTFAFPLLLGNLFQQAYNMADSIIVGRFINANALAAVGATGAISFLFFSLCNGVSGGGGIITAQFFGANDFENVKKAIVNSAYIMLVNTALMSVVAYFAAPALLRRIGTPAAILPDSIRYLQVVCVGVPFIGIYNYAASMLRALGDSRTPLLFLIVSCVINVALDLFFVRGLSMGVYGAALATILAQLIAGVGCLLFAVRRNPYFRLERRFFRPDRAICLRAVRLGLPLALQWSLIAVSSTALQAVANSFDTVAVAAFTATNRIEQLVNQPYGSLSMALATYSSQNLGGGHEERIRLGLRQGLLLSNAFSLIMFAVMQLFGGSIVSLFVREREVIELGGQALRLTSWMYVFLGLIYVTRGVLNGVGDITFSFINGIVEMLSRIFLPMLLLRIPGMGVWVIWWTTGLSWFISSSFCVMRYAMWSRRRAAARLAG